MGIDLMKAFKLRDDLKNALRTVVEVTNYIYVQMFTSTPVPVQHNAEYSEKKSLIIDNGLGGIISSK